MEIRLIVELGQEIQKRSLEYLAVSGSECVCVCFKRTHTHTDGVMSKGHRSQLKEPKVAKAGTIRATK